MLSRWERSQSEHESLNVVGVSGLEGVGKVLERPRSGAPTVVVQARLKLVLNADQTLAGQVPPSRRAPDEREVEEL